MKRRNDILILVIFITIVCGLGGLLIRDRFVGGLTPNDEKPHLWIWCPTYYNSKQWSSFYSRSNTTYTPDYIKMCIETIKRHNTHFNIHILNVDNICDYLPEVDKRQVEKNDANYNYDNFVTSILHKYGGIWMPCSTLVFKDLRPLYYHIIDNDFYLGGFSCDSDQYLCLNSKNPDRSIFIAPQHSPIIHEWKSSLSHMKHSQNDYTFKRRGINSLQHIIEKYPSKIHLFDASMNGTRDCRLKLVGPDSLLSSNIGSLANPKNLYLLNFDRNAIRDNHRHNWFEKAPRKDIIKSTLWFTLLYRAATGLNIELDENVVGKSLTRNS